MEPLQYVTIEPSCQADAAIIWLHGLGASGNDLTPIIESLRLPSSVAIRHIFPHAPMRPITWNQGMVMRAWYDITGNTLTDREDEAGIHACAQAIIYLLEQVMSQGLSANKVILAGFSQGAAMALHCGLTYQPPLAGIVALSGFIPLARKQYYARSTALDMPIFMAAGLQDQIVQFQWSQTSQAILSQHGFSQIEWHSYPMAHEICLPEIIDISLWLSKRFSKSED